ncbi:hypothetical protein MGN70_001523 [Eutypa lata]|nr:hypothetical protein MGN70_001523 [Eutypa lata]
MEQPITLEALPQELLLAILSYLCPHDLALLARVARGIGGIATSLLWTDIELHQPGYHEHSKRKAPERLAPVQRPQHCFFPSSPPGASEGSAKRAVNLFRTLNALLYERDNSGDHRLRPVASRIRSLCTVLMAFYVADEEDQHQHQHQHQQHTAPQLQLLTWRIFPHFANLENLELHGGWGLDDPRGVGGWWWWGGEREGEEEQEGFDDNAVLPRLRSATLYGYLPRGLVRWILRCARSTLERLELGVLGEPKERGDYEDGNDTYWGGFDAPSSDAFFAPRPLYLCLDDEEEREKEEGGGDEDEDEDEDGDGDGVEGKEQRRKKKKKKKETPTFPNLKYLHLCKPSECDPGHGSDPGDFVKYSYGAERGSLQDWAFLLRAARRGGALETLVLEHRGAAGEIDYDGGGHSRRRSSSSKDSTRRNWSLGGAEKRLVKSIAPVFEEDMGGGANEGGFANLRRVYLYGMFAGPDIWDRLGVRWKKGHGQWCLYDRYYGVTEWARWDAEIEGVVNEDHDDDDDNDDAESEV